MRSNHREILNRLWGIGIWIWYNWKGIGNGEIRFSEKFLSRFILLRGDTGGKDFLRILKMKGNNEGRIKNFFLCELKILSRFYERRKIFEEKLGI